MKKLLIRIACCITICLSAAEQELNTFSDTISEGMPRLNYIAELQSYFNRYDFTNIPKDNFQNLKTRVEYLLSRGFDTSRIANRAKKALLNSLLSSLNTIINNIRNPSHDATIQDCFQEYFLPTLEFLHNYNILDKETVLGESLLLLSAVNPATPQTLELIDLLLQTNINVNYASPFTHETALHLAAANDNLLLLNRLLQAPNINVNAPTNLGLTPLHYATRSIKPNNVNLLIQYNANVNARDNNGDTPLTKKFDELPHSVDDTIRIIDLLCNNGANVNAQNNQGDTALIILLLRGTYSEYERVVECLERHGADFDLADNAGITASALIVQQDIEAAQHDTDDDQSVDDDYDFA